MSALMRFMPIPKRPTVGSAVANLHGSRPMISHYVTRRMSVGGEQQPTHRNVAIKLDRDMSARFAEPNPVTHSLVPHFRKVL